eukprot:5619633-Prymnesium_polylepis.1
MAPRRIWIIILLIGGNFQPIRCRLNHLRAPHRQKSASDADFGQCRFELAAALTHRATEPWP